MAAPNLQLHDNARPAAPPESSFVSGLLNIRLIIETKLRALGMKDLRLGDTSDRCTRGVPGMVIVDVSAGAKKARVTFTRVEVEDCAQGVEVHCVLRKIDRLLSEFAR